MNFIFEIRANTFYKTSFLVHLFSTQGEISEIS